MRRELTRRDALLGIGTVTVGGTAALAAWPRDTAAITIVDLRLDDHLTKLAPNERVSGVTLAIDGEYDYDSSHDLDRVEVVLFVDVNGVGFEELASEELTDVPASVTAETYSLRADLLDHSGLSLAMFNVSEGQTTTATVAARVELRLFKSGQRVGLADAVGSAQLQITKEELVVSAAIGGTGGLQVSRATTTATA